MPVQLATTFQTTVKRQGDVVGWLKGIMGKHAKGLPVLCANIVWALPVSPGYRLRGVEGIGGPLSPKIVLRQSSFIEFSVKIHQAGKRHKLTVVYCLSSKWDQIWLSNVFSFLASLLLLAKHLVS